jgi:hypothetical protein
MLPTTVAMLSNACVCGRSIAVIASFKPAEGMDVLMFVFVAAFAKS